MAALAALVDEPERAGALRRDFLDFATRRNLGAPGGPVEYRYGYLLVVARKRRSPGPAPAPSRTAADGGRA